MNTLYKLFYHFSIISIFLTMCTRNAYSIDGKWEDFYSGLWGGDVQTVVIDPDDPNKIYIGTIGGGFFYSINSGTDWTRLNTDLGSWNIYSLLVKKINTKIVIYAGTENGIYKLESLNSGWIKYNHLNGQSIKYLWHYSSNNSFFYTFSTVPNTATRNLWRINIETNKLKQIMFDSLTTTPFIFDLISGEDTSHFKVATDSGFFRFWDDRIEYNRDRQNRLHIPTFCIAQRPFTLPGDEETTLVYAGTQGGGRFSINKGLDWYESQKFMDDISINVLASQKWDDYKQCYAGTNEGSVWRHDKSNNSPPERWLKPSNSNLPTLAIQDLQIRGDNYQTLIAANQLGIYFSEDGANSWSDDILTNLNAHQIHAFFYQANQGENYLWSATQGSLFRRNLSITSKIWDIEENLYANFTTFTFDPVAKCLYAGTDGDGIYKKSSIETGDWIQNLNGLTDKNITAVALNATSNLLYAGTRSGKLFLSSNGALSWSEIANLKNLITDILCENGNYHVMTSSKGGYKNPSGTPVKPDWDKTDIFCLAKIENSDSIFAGTNEGIYVYDIKNNNYIWTLYSLANKSIYKLEIPPTKLHSCGILYAQVNDLSNKTTQIYRQIIGHSNLIDSTPAFGFPEHQIGESFCVDQNHPNTIYLGTSGSGVFRYSFPDDSIPEDLPKSHDFQEKALDEIDSFSFDITNPNKFMPLFISTSLSGKDTNNFKIALTDSKILPESTVTCTITFNPLLPAGKKEAKLNLTISDIFISPDTSKFFEITLSGFLKYGEFDIDSTQNTTDTNTLHFNPTHTGDTSSRTVSWEAIGNAALSNFNIIRTTSTQFSDSGFPDDSILPQTKGSIRINFRPTRLGLDTGRYFIKYKYLVNGILKDGKTKTIIVNALGTEAILKLNPSDSIIDFGLVPQVDQTDDLKLIFMNTGNIPLVIDSFYITNIEKERFQINKVSSTIIEGDTIPNIISEDREKYLSIFFSPSGDIGSFSATLFIIYHDSSALKSDTLKIQLKGEGTQHILEPIPEGIWPFGKIHVKKASTDACLDTFYLRNSSKEEFTIDILKLIIQEKKHFSLIKPTSCCNSDGTPLFQITPGDSDSLIIKFKTDSVGLYKDSLEVYYRYWKIKGTEIIYSKEIIKGIKLTATATSGLLENLPTVLDWDKKVHVTLSNNDSVKLKNLGNIPLNYNFSSPKPPFYLINSIESSGVIGPYSSISTKFKFEPTDIDSHSESIPIHFWDLEQKQGLDTNITLILAGTGVDAIASLAESLIFKDTHIADSCTSSVTLKNIGNIPMLNVSMTHDTPAFKIIDTSFPKILPQDSQTFQVIFKPTAPGPYYDNLKITYSDSYNFQNTHACSLSGTGRGSKLVFYDSTCDSTIKLPFDLGEVHWDNTSMVSKEICLKNKGNLDLILDSTKFPVPIFSIIPGNQNVAFPITIAPDNNEKFIVTFKPNHVNDHQDKGFFYGHELFETKPYKCQDTLSLRGVGTGACLVPVDSNFKIDFKEWQILSKKGDGESKPITLTLKNIGTFTCKIVTYLFNTADQKDYSCDSLIPTTEIEPDSCCTFILSFLPIKLGDKPEIWTIEYHETDEKYNNYSRDTFITLNGKGIDTIPPEIKLLTQQPLIPTINESIVIQTKIWDEHSGLQKSSPGLWIRRGGEKVFSQVNYATPLLTDSTYHWIISGDIVTSRGIEFYVTALDSNPTEGRLPYNPPFNYFSPRIHIPEFGIRHRERDGDIAQFHIGDAQSDYRLISIPIQIDAELSSAKEILEKYLVPVDHTLWRCANYSYSLQKYEYLDQGIDFIFESGKAFFLLVSEQTKKYIKLPEFVLYSKSGLTHPTNQYFKMPLIAGWNLIANPFNFPIPKTNLILNDSVRLRTLRDYLGQWEKLSIKDSTHQYLFPWEGYAIHVINNDTLIINPDLSLKNKMGNLSSLATTANYQWHIRIEARCQQAQDIDNFAAVSDNAVIEYDDLDEPEPPPIGEYIMLSFPHPEWKTVTNFYSGDVQSFQQDGNSWNFEIFTNIKNSEVRLAFHNLNMIQTDKQIALICEHLNYKQDLRQKSDFTFNSTTARTGYKFRLIVGNNEFLDNHNQNIDFLPKNFQFSANFPNPFTGSTNIQYSLPKASKVTILIYNLIGEVVKKILEDEIQDAGRNFIIWDGTNSLGTRVSNGMYFCEFYTPGFSKTIKMIIVK